LLPPSMLLPSCRAAWSFRRRSAASRSREWLPRWPGWTHRPACDRGKSGAKPQLPPNNLPRSTCPQPWRRYAPRSPRARLRLRRVELGKRKWHREVLFRVASGLNEPITSLFHCRHGQISGVWSPSRASAETGLCCCPTVPPRWRRSGRVASLDLNPVRFGRSLADVAQQQGGGQRPWCADTVAPPASPRLRLVLFLRKRAPARGMEAGAL